MGNTNSLQIRAATGADTTTLAALSDQLGYPSSVQEVARRLDTILGLEDHAVFVAVVMDQVCGWAHVFMAHRLESEDFAEIGGLVVDTAWRGQGVGKALVRATESWALTRALTTMRVRSNIVRTGAHRFYTRLGYASLKQSTVFVRSLEARR